MTYNKSAYGADPKNPWLENYDNGWGPYAWPQGVPSNLLGKVTTKDGTKITIRRELVALAQRLVDASENQLGYAFHTPSGGNTAGYVNREIRGGTGPSSHSRARAIDTRAVDNPQSYTFKCVIPPAVVRLWEACGWYWGGRYVGAPYDTQHFSYIGQPKDVPVHIARATNLINALTEKDEMKATDPMQVRDAYYPTVHKGASVDRTLSTENVIKTAFNYGSVATRDGKVNAAEIAELKKQVATLQKQIAELIKK